MMFTLLILSAQLLLGMPVMTQDSEEAEYMPTPAPFILTSGELVEGRVVTITCSAPADISIPKLKWNLREDSQNQVGPSTIEIQENVTLSDKHDGMNISCSASYPQSDQRDATIARSFLTLDVSYPPKDAMMIISPTDPVSVGSVVNLTCSCRGNPPAVIFGWITVTDGILEMSDVNTKCYSFTVTNSDRGRLYYCGCANVHGRKFSPGRQLFKGDPPVGVQVILKTLGITMLVSVLVIFECWLRSRRSIKPVKEAVEADYVNSVIQIQAS